MERLSRGEVSDISFLDDSLLGVRDREGVEGDPGNCIVGAIDRVEEDSPSLPVHIDTSKLLTDQALAERAAREVIHNDILCDLIDLLRGCAVRTHLHVLSRLRCSDHISHCITDSLCQGITRQDELCQVLLIPPPVLVYLPFGAFGAEREDPTPLGGDRSKSPSALHPRRPISYIYMIDDGIYLM